MQLNSENQIVISYKAMVDSNIHYYIYTLKKYSNILHRTFKIINRFHTCTVYIGIYLSLRAPD